MPNRKNTKIQISIDPALLVEVDCYCQEHFMNRSGFFTMCALGQIQAAKMGDAMQEMCRVLRDAIERSDGSGITDIDRKRLDDIQRLANLICK